MAKAKPKPLGNHLRIWHPTVMSAEASGMRDVTSWLPQQRAALPLVTKWNGEDDLSSTALNVVEENDRQSGTTDSPIAYTHIECGLRPAYESILSIDKSITEGRYAKDGEFPWHVSIQSNGKHICGGTVISALWVLTAARCFAEEVPPDLIVVMGGTDLELPLEEYQLDRLILHENFNKTSLQNDIALILLRSPIEFSSKKIPVCLPFMYDTDMWQHCWVTGWGTTSAVSGSRQLQKTQMKLISREHCSDRILLLGDNMLCAEVQRAEERTCQVDSGGPLVCSYWNTMKWFQVGIVSWAEDCAEKPNLDVLMSVYHYVGWIENQTATTGKPFFVEGVDKRSSVAFEAITHCPIARLILDEQPTKNGERSYPEIWQHAEDFGENSVSLKDMACNVPLGNKFKCETLEALASGSIP
ncbi:serine protease 55-like [Apus apus]|uniref:serine protease 55-like n=1 Tax=Apus apus TaxID=8895 RepID=UPI0021F9014E|nr:serine protease 55-like [Apus apus]